MNITKEQIAEWIETKANTTNTIDLIHDCIQDLGPKWVSVNDSIPKEGERVLLRTTFSDSCPNVIGYIWRGMWEACTVNVYATNANSCVDTYFLHSDVTHWMPLPEPPK